MLFRERHTIQTWFRLFNTFKHILQTSDFNDNCSNIVINDIQFNFVYNISKHEAHTKPVYSISMIVCQPYYIQLVVAPLASQGSVIKGEERA